MKRLVLLAGLLGCAAAAAPLSMEFNGNLAVQGLGRPVQGEGKAKFADHESAVISRKDCYFIPHCGKLNPDKGALEVRLKPLDWDGLEPAYQFFFICRGKDHDAVQLQRAPNGYLQFVIGSRPVFSAISRPVADWKTGEWHTVRVTWDRERLGMTVDGQAVKKVKRRYQPLQLNERFQIGGEWYAPCQGKTAIDYLKLDTEPLPLPPSLPADKRKEDAQPANWKPLPRNIATADCRAVMLPSAQFYGQPGKAVEMAMDGIWNTGWHSGMEMKNPWLEIRWPQPVEVDGIRMNFQRPWAPAACRIEYAAKDGWREIAALTKNLEEFHPFAPVKTERLRIHFTSGRGKQVAVRELQVTGNAPKLFLPKSSWRGCFIWYPEASPNNVIRYFRRDFELGEDKRVRTAKLQICADDSYVAYVNGQKVGAGGLAPGVYDVAGLVRPGRNAIAVRVKENGGAEGLLAELTLLGESGDPVRIGTDSQWRTARKAEPGWEQPEFDARGWEQAVRSPSLPRYAVLIPHRAFAMAENPGLAVQALSLPATVRPGAELMLTAKLTCRETPKYRYGFRLTIGEKALSANTDYTVAMADVYPEAPSPQWVPGKEYAVSWKMAIPSWAPHGELPVRIQALSPEGEAAVKMADAKLRIKRFAVDPQLRRKPVKAAIESRNGRMRMVVNGKVMPSMIFALNGSYNTTFRELGEESSVRTGVYRYSLADCSIYPPEGADPDAYFTALFAKIDQQLNHVLRLFPNAYLLVVLGLRPNYSDSHPDEALQFPDGAKSMHSFSSELWLQRSIDGGRRVIRHLRESDYAGHIAGINFFIGGGAESMIYNAHRNRLDTPRDQVMVGDFSPPAIQKFREFLRRRYHNDVTALRQAWKKPAVDFEHALPDIAELRRMEQQNFRNPATGTMAMDYWSFHSDAVADAAARIASAFKQAVNNEWLVGVWGFYGLAQYPIMCTANPGALHHIGSSSLSKILNTPALDYLVCIQSYAGIRRGTPLVTTTPAASFKLHGKLFVEEFDIRTFFTDLSFSHSHTLSQPETLAVMKRDFGEALTRGAYCWFCGFARSATPRQAIGWYAEDSLSKLLNRFAQISQAVEAYPNQSAAEVALFVNKTDIVTMDVMNHSAGTLANTQYNTIYRELRHLPVPYDCYVLDDFNPAMLTPYKVVIMLNAFYLNAAARRKIRRTLEQLHKTVIWLYAPGYSDPQQGLSVENIRELTGFRIGVSPEYRSRLQVTINSPGFQTHTFGPYQYHHSAAKLLVGPVFNIDDPDAGVLGRYLHNGKAAVAMKKVGGMTGYYCAVPLLSKTLMEDIFRRSGIHFYADAPIYLQAGSRLLSLHAPADVKTTIHLPRRASILDLYSGRIVGQNTMNFPVELPKGASRLYFIGAESEIAALANNLK